jgi:hypothetical protein
MAPKGKSQHSANFGYDHGKAVLCSNIHQRGKLEAYNREYRRVYGHRGKDQGTQGRDKG